MFQDWSKRQKILVTSYFGFVLVAGVALLVLNGGFNFKADQPLGAYDNQANLSYADSQGQSRNLQSNIVALKKTASVYPLSGKVTNSAGQPVAGAKVYIYRQAAYKEIYKPIAFDCPKYNDPSALNVTTDSNGNYFFTKIPPGEYYQLVAVPPSVSYLSFSCNGYVEENILIVSSNSDYRVAMKTMKTGSQSAQVDLSLKNIPRYHNHLWVSKGDPTAADGADFFLRNSSALGDARMIIRNIETGQIVYDKQSDTTTGEITISDEDLNGAVPSEGDGSWKPIRRYITKEGYTDITMPYYAVPLGGYVITSLPGHTGANRQYSAGWVFENLKTTPILSGATKNSGGSPIGKTALILKSKQDEKFQFVTGSKTTDGSFSFTKICANPNNPTVNCKNIPTGDYTLEAIPTSEYQSKFIDPVHIIDGQTTNLGDIVFSGTQKLSSLPQSSSEAVASLSKEAASNEPQTTTQQELIGLSVLSGTLTDPKTNAPIEAATVSIKDSSGNVVSSATTDKDGKYSLSSPQTGSLKAEIKKEGYKTQTKDISLAKDQKFTLDGTVSKQNRVVAWLQNLWTRITKGTK